MLQFVILDISCFQSENVRTEMTYTSSINYGINQKNTIKKQSSTKQRRKLLKSH